MFESFDNKLLMIQDKIDHGNLDGALFLIRSFVEFIISKNSSTAVVFSSAELDKLCEEAGAKALAARKNLASLNDPFHSDTVVYFASALFMSGGHTGVIQDLIQAQPQKQHIIFVTEMLPSSEHALILKRFSGLPVIIEWSTNPGFIKQVRWLQTKLIKLKPARLFLFNHNQDAVIIAAAQPELAQQTIFYHHGDHQLCLGVHLTHALHVDPHSFGWENCRKNLGLKNNIYWPLTQVDLGVRPTNSFMKTGRLVTCSSGSQHKFEVPYRYKYQEMIPEILATTKGVHIHIGDLSQSTIDSIQAAMSKRNIPLDRFIMIPWVKSLWKAMIDNNVDIYLTSFPYGGAKAAIEVMGSGTPIVTHRNNRSELLSGAFVIYPTAFCWRQPSDLYRHLSFVKIEDLVIDSNLSREHYATYYRPEILATELSKNDLSQGLMPPPVMSDFKSDGLQVFLDIYRELYQPPSIQEKKEEYHLIKDSVQYCKRLLVRFLP